MMNLLCKIHILIFRLKFNYNVTYPCTLSKASIITTLFPLITYKKIICNKIYKERKIYCIKQTKSW